MNFNEQKPNPIDVVITWVDGNDPKFIERINPFLKGKDRNAIPGAHQTRFGSINEIRYCVLSILKFAPFVRNIYIVTDGQNPNLCSDIKKHFPERVDSVSIVDHKTIFRGFEAYLPTFNSRTIESMLWRIPGLSNNFVYFNDDLFLIRQIDPSDWFVNNQPVMRGKWLLAPTSRIIWNFVKLITKRYLLSISTYETRPSFHLGQWVSARIAGYRARYFINSHTPHAVGSNLVGEFLSGNQPLLEKNISYRFRNRKQFNFVALSNHLQLKNGNSHIANPDLAYLSPHNRKNGYVKGKIKSCEANGHIKFLCVQSLELCSGNDQQRLFDWMDRLLGLRDHPYMSNPNPTLTENCD